MSEFMSQVDRSVLDAAAQRWPRARITLVSFFAPDPPRDCDRIHHHPSGDWDGAVVELVPHRLRHLAADGEPVRI